MASFPSIPRNLRSRPSTPFVAKPVYPPATGLRTTLLHGTPERIARAGFVVAEAESLMDRLRTQPTWTAADAKPPLLAQHPDERVLLALLSNHGISTKSKIARELALQLWERATVDARTMRHAWTPVLDALAENLHWQRGLPWAAKPSGYQDPHAKRTETETRLYPFLDTPDEFVIAQVVPWAERVTDPAELHAALTFENQTFLRGVARGARVLDDHLVDGLLAKGGAVVVTLAMNPALSPAQQRRVGTWALAAIGQPAVMEHYGHGKHRWSRADWGPIHAMTALLRRTDAAELSADHAAWRAALLDLLGPDRAYGAPSDQARMTLFDVLDQLDTAALHRLLAIVTTPEDRIRLAEAPAADIPLKRAAIAGDNSIKLRTAFAEDDACRRDPVIRAWLRGSTSAAIWLKLMADADPSDVREAFRHAAAGDAEKTLERLERAKGRILQHLLPEDLMLLLTPERPQEWRLRVMGLIPELSAPAEGAPSQPLVSGKPPRPRGPRR